MSMHAVLSVHASTTSKHESTERLIVSINSELRETLSPFVLPEGQKCSISNKTFEERILTDLTTDGKIRYVIARIWDPSNREYLADGSLLQDKILLADYNFDNFVVPGMNTTIKSIEYFSTRNQRAPFSWIPLKKIIIGNIPSPDFSFIEAYIFCAAAPELKNNNLLNNQHKVIDYFIDNNDEELYFWLSRTATDFPNDPYAYALLEKLFDTDFDIGTDEEREQFRKQISMLKWQDGKDLITHLGKLAIGFVTSHYIPKEVSLGIFGGYWFVRALIAKCCMSDQGPYKLAKKLNTLFMGVFLGETVEGILKMALKRPTPAVGSYMDTLNPVLGIVSLLTACRYSPKGSRFETWNRLRSVCSRTLYVEGV